MDMAGGYFKRIINLSPVEDDILDICNNIKDYIAYGKIPDLEKASFILSRNKRGSTFRKKACFPNAF